MFYFYKKVKPNIYLTVRFLQVKIIKCLVENIVVDISFNQLGGLCTLCFLEEVMFYSLILAVGYYSELVMIGFALS